MAECTGFFLYLDQHAPIADLTLEQKGMLLDAMFAFNAGEPFVLTDPVARVAFGFFKASFQREQQKYAEICRRRKAAAKSRWDANAPTASDARQAMQMDANARDAMQTMPEPEPEPEERQESTLTSFECLSPLGDACPQRGPDGQEESRQSSAKRQKSAGPQSSPPPCPYEQIRDMYHRAFPEHPRVALLSAKRKGSVKARWGDAGRRLRELQRPDCAAERLAYFQRLFHKAAMSDVLTGKKAFRDGGVYRVDFDKLMSPGGFMGVIEGKYDNRTEA